MSRKGDYCASVAMHGTSELTGLVLRDSLQEDPIDNWDVEVANPAAVEADVRYVRRNLASAFAEADHESDVEELRRAAELIDLAADYKAVVDIHDRPDATGEYAMLGPDSDPRMLGVAALLGVRNIVISQHGNIYADHASNVVAIDFCRGSSAHANDVLVPRNVQRIRRCMGRIARYGIPLVRPDAFDYYVYEHAISADEADRLKLDDLSVGVLPFQVLPRAAVERLGLEPATYVAESWGGINSSGGEYFGEVYRKMEEPPF